MAIELAVFDMAGTTVDDQGGVVNRCFRETLASHGLAAEPEQVDAVMGLPKPEAFRILVGRSPLAELLIGRLDALHAEFVRLMITFYSENAAVRAVPGIEDLFRTLHTSGVKIALNTGFNRPITDVILNRLGWTPGGLIDAVVSSDEVPRGRPHPDMILRLASQLGVTDSRSIVKIGDAPADLEEGFAAHCRWSIGVTWGTHTRAQLEHYPHTHLVDSVDELGQLFESALRT